MLRKGQEAFCCSRQNISRLTPQRAPQISRPANCTNSSFKVPMRQLEVPCPLEEGGSFYCKPPARSQSHGRRHSIRQTPTPGHPPHHPHICWEPLSWETPPQFQTALPRPRVSQLGRVEVSRRPSFPGPPPHTPLESTSQAGRNHQRGPPPNGSTELTLDNEGLRREGRERLRDLGISPAGHPKQKWGTGCLWFGNLGRRGLGEEPPYPCLSRVLLTSSGQSRVGREPWERAGRPPPQAPPL